MFGDGSTSDGDNSYDDIAERTRSYLHHLDVFCNSQRLAAADARFDWSNDSFAVVNVEYDGANYTSSNRSSA